MRIPQRGVISSDDVDVKNSIPSGALAIFSRFRLNAMFNHGPRIKWAEMFVTPFKVELFFCSYGKIVRLKKECPILGMILSPGGK